MTIKEFTVAKELLIPLAPFSNVKIVTSITSDKDIDEAWAEVNKQIISQENLEKSLRLSPKPSKDDSWKPAPDLPF